MFEVLGSAFNGILHRDTISQSLELCIRVNILGKSFILIYLYGDQNGIFTYMDIRRKDFTIYSYCNGFIYLSELTV